MKRVIKLSKAWIAALFMGLLITGCGGGSQSSGSADQTVTGKSALLSWNAPFKRVNGETLAMGELSGYVISYGQDPEKLTNIIKIKGASTMAYNVTNLTGGTWYFTVQVEDDNGLVSAPSGQVSKTI